MKTFSFDGMEYNSDIAWLLRKDLIKARDRALDACDFEVSIKLSHTIVMYTLLAQHLWGDNWVASQLKKDGSRGHMGREDVSTGPSCEPVVEGSID